MAVLRGFLMRYRVAVPHPASSRPSSNSLNGVRTHHQSPSVAPPSAAEKPLSHDEKHGDPVCLAAPRRRPSAEAREPSANCLRATPDTVRTHAKRLRAESFSAGLYAGSQGSPRPARAAEGARSARPFSNGG